VSRFLLSPWILASLFIFAGQWGAAFGQDEEKDDLPPPRVVSEQKKTMPEETKKVETKKEEQPVVLPKPPEQEPAKEEEKKEEAKVDPLAEVKTLAEKGVKDAETALQRGDNSWILVSAAFVLLMTPGLALFYGGMVRRKNVLATMMQSYAAMAVVGLYWVAVGYGLAFGPSQIKVDMWGVEDGGIIGWDWKLFFLQGVEPSDYLPNGTIPVLTHVMFQGMFAILTPALISGAIAERIRFWPWTIFMILWVTFVYCPLAHMVWAFDWYYFDPATPGSALGESAIGLLGKMGALDFAGGTVVHIAAGFAGLACIIVLKKRTGYPEHAMHPNSMVLTLVGAALLWFGWFGFNGGSALGSGDLASTGFATTQAAAAGAGLSWMVVEWIFKGKPTALGLASGIVAGLVAVTPASGFVYAWGGAIIGIIAGIVCYFMVQAKTLLGYDDSLDAFGIHGIGGFLGAVLTGVFCYAAVQGSSADGFFAHRGLQGNISSLKEEVSDLGKEIEAIQKTEPELKKKSDAAEAAVANAKDDKTKEELQKKADAAKADYEEVARKIERREARIKAIGSESVDESEIKNLRDKIDGYKKDEKGPMTQLGIQFKAAIFSAIFAFVLSLALAYLVQFASLGNFRTSVPDESEGLDYTEHGESGFDFGGIDTLPVGRSTEPKAARVPPGGKRFEVVVEGAENGSLLQAWSQLCQPSEEPADADFKAVYPFVTTVQGNRFRLRGGDPKSLSTSIQNLFQKKLGRPLRVRVEE
jgi:ammonium transporter, Amt family